MHGLLTDFTIRQAHAEEANSMAALARAENGMRRIAMLQGLDRLWEKYESLEGTGLPTGEVLAEW